MPAPADTLDALVHLYENLTPQRVGELAACYREDAHFRDPFNDVRGRAAIERIFSHMFTQVEAPKFTVQERFFGESGSVMLLWRFDFTLRGPQSIAGTSHLCFDEDGRVAEHIDYWDAAGELYARVPLLGGLMRLLRRALAAR